MDIKQNIFVAVDAVVFGYSSAQGLSVLLIKRKNEPCKGCWALPGGFVRNGESLEDAIYRELHEETAVKINYLEQLYSFGLPTRDPRAQVVSVTYFALVRPDAFEIKANTDAQEAQWFALNNIKKLAFDHHDILEVALKRLRGKLQYEPIGFELLDKKFPFSELENLYSSVLNRPLDRRNFKKKIMKYGLLDQTDEVQKHQGSGRPGKLYSFNEKKYFELKQRGILFEI